MVSFSNLVDPIKQFSSRRKGMTTASDKFKRKSCIQQSKLYQKIYPTFENSYNDNLLVNKSNKLFSQANEIKNLENHIKTLSTENKMIRTKNIRQQKEIDNIPKQETFVENCLKQTECSIFNLRELVRKTQRSLLQEQKLNKDRETKASELRNALYKEQGTVLENHLLEKLNIKIQLSHMQDTLASKESELEALRRQIFNQDKNYKIEVGHAQKQAQSHVDKCQELKSHINFLKVSLKEKQQLFDKRNILTKRNYLQKINKVDCEKLSFNNNVSKPVLRSGIHKNLTLRKSQIGLTPIAEINNTNLEKINEIKYKHLSNKVDRPKIVEKFRPLISDKIRTSKSVIVNKQLENYRRLQLSSPIKSPSDETIPEIPNINDDKDNTDEISSNIESIDSKENLSLASEDYQIPDKVVKKKVNFCLPSDPQPIATGTNVYQFPNKNALIENEDWLKDIETITVNYPNCGSCAVENVQTNVGTINNTVRNMFQYECSIIDDVRLSDT